MKLMRIKLCLILAALMMIISSVPMGHGATAGTTTIGGSTGELQCQNYVYAFEIDIENHGASVTNITAYLNWSTVKNVNAALYYDDGGKPGALVVKSTAIPVSTANWYNWTVARTNITEGKYWIALGEGTYTATQNTYYDVGTHYVRYGAPSTLTDPAPSTSQFASSRDHSIYITYDIIPWTPPLSTNYTHGQLRVGNETEGQNPCFFYGDDDQLITLRQYQDGHLDRDDTGAYGQTYYTDTIRSDWPAYTTGPYIDYTWANATIQYAVDAGFNTLRIHMFLGKNQADLFPTYKAIDPIAFRYFLEHLTEAKNNDLYYALDGYFHDSGAVAWWFTDEMMNSSVLWNTTVRDDFIYVWESMVQEIYTNSTTYDGLLYIQPWSEWFLGGTADNILIWARDPYRYNGDDVYGNASLVSWNNWLNTTFSNNATHLNLVFDEGTTDKFNETTEIAFFNTSMPSASFSSSSVRAYYFSRWYDECVYNFTSYFNTQLKTSFPDLYISWDGFAATFGGAGNANAVTSAYTCIENSDVLDHHTFGSVSAGYGNWDGDELLDDYTVLSGLSRALKIPLIVGEQGIATSQATGYDAVYDDETVAHWREITNMMLTQGYAGWTPYWCNYIHSYASTQNYVDDADRRIPALIEINKEWEAAENYIDKTVYKNITMLVSLGTSYRDGQIQTYPYALGNIVPKYAIWSIGNGTRIPTSIPPDTDILIMGGDYYANYYYFPDDLRMVNEWLENDTDHKLILHYFTTQDHHLNTLRLENYFNTSLFPINNMVYGAGYTASDNSTDCYVTAWGDQVLLNRSDNYHSQHGMTFNPADITGTTLVSITDSNKPFVIASNQVAWVGCATEMYEALAASRAYNYEYDIWKIYYEILDNWGYVPMVYASSGTREVCSYSYIEPNNAIITVGCNNVTSSETYSFRLAATIHGITGNVRLFDELSETTENTTAALLNTLFMTDVTANNTNHLAIRTPDQPRYFFTDGYLVNETWTDANETLTLRFNARENAPRTGYVYWNATPSGNLRYDNGTTLRLFDLYDSNESLITFYYTGDTTVWLDGFNVAPNTPIYILPLNATRYDPAETLLVTWTFVDTTPVNDNQTAYELEIDNSPDFITPLLDTGKVTSGVSSYTGTAPLTVGIYYIRIRTWDEFDEVSPWNNSLAIITDRVILLTLAVNTAHPDEGQPVTVTATAENEYDHHTLVGTDTLILRTNDGQNITMAYVGAVWTGTHTEAAAVTRIINAGFVNETTYDVDSLSMNGNSVSVTWGEVQNISGLIDPSIEILIQFIPLIALVFGLEAWNQGVIGSRLLAFVILIAVLSVLAAALNTM